MPEADTAPASTPGEPVTGKPDLPGEGPGADGGSAGARADAPSFEPAGPAPLGVERTPTGRPEVDGPLERLADADHLAADGHIEVYEDVHRGLKDALTSLDSRPAAAPGPRPVPTPMSSHHPHHPHDPSYDTHDHRS